MSTKYTAVIFAFVLNVAVGCDTQNAAIRTSDEVTTTTSQALTSASTGDAGAASPTCGYRPGKETRTYGHEDPKNQSRFAADPAAEEKSAALEATLAAAPAPTAPSPDPKLLERYRIFAEQKAGLETRLRGSSTEDREKAIAELKASIVLGGNTP